MAMASMMSGNRLLLLSDMPSAVIDGKSGYAHTNQSWVLGRVLRDFEDRHWIDPQISNPLDIVLADTGRPKAGFYVSFVEAKGRQRPAKGTKIDDPVSEVSQTGKPAIKPKLNCCGRQATC